MPRKETLKVLEDLEKGGLDVSGILNQIRTNPLAERVADNIVGGGILRQADYQRYMNDVATREQQIKQHAQELATLHDAKNVGAELAQSTLDRMKFLEDKLIEVGDFDPDSVRNLSIKEKQGLEEVVKTPVNNNNLLQRNTGLQNLNNNNDFGRQSFVDTSNLVDLETHQKSMANLAYGTIASNIEINAALDEVRALGIPVDRKKAREFQENLRNGFEAGQNLDQVLEKTFEVSKKIQEKQQTDLAAQLKAAEDKGRAEALKEAGVPDRSKFQRSRHPIFDRKREDLQVSTINKETKEGEEKPNSNPNEPRVNKFGDREIFRERGTRDQRLSRAIETNNEVHEYLEKDPTYVP